MVITDEEQPLLRIITQDSEHLPKNDEDEVLPDFDPLDPEDPRNWTPFFKWGIVFLLALMAFTV